MSVRVQGLRRPQQHVTPCLQTFSGNSEGAFICRAVGGQVCRWCFQISQSRASVLRDRQGSHLWRPKTTHVAFAARLHGCTHTNSLLHCGRISGGPCTARMPLRRRGRRRSVQCFFLLTAICWYVLWGRSGTAKRAVEAPSALRFADHSDGRCGSGWQQRYATLHKTILEGRPPKRLCVALIREEQGLYDRMTGIALTPLRSQHPLTALPALSVANWHCTPDF